MSTLLQLALAMIMITILVFRSSLVVAELPGNLLQAVGLDKTPTKPFPPSPPSPSPSPFPLLKKKKSPPPPRPRPPAAAAPSPQPPPPPAPFDYFMLALTWPPSFCKVNVKPCKQTPLKFTIHGLWPQNNTGAQPQDCDPSSNLGGIPQNLESKLIGDWPDLTKSAPGSTTLYSSFWSYEWKKHGTCSLMHQLDYLDLALTLYGKQDIKNDLGNAGISPGGPNSIFTNQIVVAIRKNIGGFTPHLQCKYDVNTQRDYLLEIRLCFDKASQYENCRPTTNCPQKVYFPS